MNIPSRYITGDYVPGTLEEAFGNCIDSTIESLLYAAIEIEKLMRTDSFVRFKKHPYWIDFYVEAKKLDMFHVEDDGSIVFSAKASIQEALTDNLPSKIEFSTTEESSNVEDSINMQSTHVSTKTAKRVTEELAKKRGLFHMVTPRADPNSNEPPS